jgi:hypothetical protein
MMQMEDMVPKDLMFTFSIFSLALVWFFLDIPLIFENEYIYCAIVCWEYVIFKNFYRGSETRDCYET